MDIITIEIPQYVTRIKVSNSRKSKYYTPDSEIPKKYQAENYSFHKGFLIDNTTKKRVVSNSNVAGKPRYMSIAGRRIWTGGNSKGSEHVRIKTVNAIKDNFRPYVSKIATIGDYPIQVDVELYCAPGATDWDLDNLWVYCKCFMDLLKDEGKIKDDCIRYVTKPPIPEYFPIINNDNRKMIFKIRKDIRNITNHVVFNTTEENIFYVKNQWSTIKPVIHLCTDDLRSGEIVFEEVSNRIDCKIGIYKSKRLWETITNALLKCFTKAVQYNTEVVIDRNFGSDVSRFNWDIFEGLIKTYLSNKGIKVIIHNA